MCYSTSPTPPSKSVLSQKHLLLNHSLVFGPTRDRKASTSMLAQTCVLSNHLKLECAKGYLKVHVCSAHMQWYCLLLLTPLVASRTYKLLPVFSVQYEMSEVCEHQSHAMT